jgi:hypothetical protein
VDAPESHPVEFGFNASQPLPLHVAIAAASTEGVKVKIKLMTSVIIANLKVLSAGLVFAAILILL